VAPNFAERSPRDLADHLVGELMRRR
jgi:hypothetical protein